jgi:hypothetical protein
VAANVEAPASAEEVASLRAQLAAARAQLARRGFSSAPASASGAASMLLPQLVQSGGRALAEAVARAEHAESVASSLRLALASSEDAAAEAEAAALAAAVARDALALRLEGLTENAPEGDDAAAATSEGVLRTQLGTIASLRRCVRALSTQLLAAGLRPCSIGTTTQQPAATSAHTAEEEAEEDAEEGASDGNDDGNDDAADAGVGERTLAALAAQAEEREGVFEARAAAHAAELAALDAALAARENELGDSSGSADGGVTLGVTHAAAAALSEEKAAALRARYERVLEQMEAEREALVRSRPFARPCPFTRWPRLFASARVH